MNNIPYFSICIPSYNRGYVLRRCLDSLVQQEYNNFEVIFVDDGSTDDTSEIVDEYKKLLNIKYIKKENGGKHTALNCGITNSSDSELFSILDSDDWLPNYTLKVVHDIWEKIKQSTELNSVCGIIGKCCDQTGSVIGDMFPQNGEYLFRASYNDIHFKKFKFGDCSDWNRTSIIKKYSFPEPPGTKFVPEYYVFDQIGIYYDLLCINRVFKCIEYLPDGITRNYQKFMSDNVIGFLYGYVCRLDEVMKLTRTRIKYYQKIFLWYEYWKLVKIDKNNDGPRVKKVTVIGLCGRILLLIRNLKNTMCKWLNK